MRVSLYRGRFRVVGSDSPGRRGFGNVVGSSRVVVVVEVVCDAVSVVVSVVVVDSDADGSVGPVISVVDTGTLVVNVVEVSDGVITNGWRSRVLDGGAEVGAVVSTVAGGLLQSSDSWTTATTRAMSRIAPMPPAVKTAAVVRYQGVPPGSLSDATGADPNPAPFARTLDDR